MAAREGDTSKSCHDVDSWQHPSCLEAEDDSSSCFSPFHLIQDFFSLFLVLNGIAAQEPQAVLLEKLDKLLAGQGLQETREFDARKANSACSHRRISLLRKKTDSSSQTGQRDLESEFSRTDHTGSDWIQEKGELASGRE